MNIVIGNPLVTIEDIFGDEKVEIETERFLPKILVKRGIFKSTSQVRKNRPDLGRNLDDIGFEEIKVGKRHLFILIGE